MDENKVPAIFIPTTGRFLGDKLLVIHASTKDQPLWCTYSEARFGVGGAGGRAAGGRGVGRLAVSTLRH